MMFDKDDHITMLEHALADAKADTERLDWLEEHSFCFLRNKKTGKGVIRLSDAYVGQDGYGLRKAIDEELAHSGQKTDEAMAGEPKTAGPHAKASADGSALNGDAHPATLDGQKETP